MKVRQITRRPRWRLTTHLHGLYGMVSLQRGPFWMVRSLADYQPRRSR
ncbi:hypothetical protein PQR01_00335 [Paraburkholderia rhynchosiae]|uniref:Uncharacterized protein n=1 Tax=Paraburkholderia rhynchosiae TaxID=487049 RepID=A0ACC7N8B5_9BURK